MCCRDVYLSAEQYNNFTGQSVIKMCEKRDITKEFFFEAFKKKKNVNTGAKHVKSSINVLIHVNCFDFVSLSAGAFQTVLYAMKKFFSLTNRGYS